MPHYLRDLLGEAVSTALQNFDDLLMMGRIFSKTNLQLPEELAAFFKCLLLFELTKRKTFTLLFKNTFPSVSSWVKQAEKCPSCLFVLHVYQHPLQNGEEAGEEKQDVVPGEL